MTDGSSSYEAKGHNQSRISGNVRNVRDICGYARRFRKPTGALACNAKTTVLMLRTGRQSFVRMGSETAPVWRLMFGCHARVVHVTDGAAIGEQNGDNMRGKPSSPARRIITRSPCANQQRGQQHRYGSHPRATEPRRICTYILHDARINRSRGQILP